MCILAIIWLWLRPVSSHLPLHQRRALTLRCRLCMQATKAAIGRLRPDFLDRCKPAAGVNGKYAFQLSIASEADPNCTETDQSLLKDGRSSFPSGASAISEGLLYRQDPLTHWL